LETLEEGRGLVAALEGALELTLEEFVLLWGFGGDATAEGFGLRHDGGSESLDVTNRARERAATLADPGIVRIPLLPDACAEPTEKWLELGERRRVTGLLGEIPKSVHQR